MKCIIQRVSQASVTVEKKIVGKIGKGFLVLVGVGHGDTAENAKTLAGKTSRLRIFEDNEGKMNKSIMETNGQIMAVSQFTLMADTRKGNRPSFINAASPETAEPLYNNYCAELEKLGIHVEKGIFGAHMEVMLVNDGPVTIILEN